MTFLLVLLVASEEGAFYAATRLVEDGRPEDAAAAFVALADRAAEDPFADDALGEAARLYEERLRDPVRAAELYERLARDYPSSRLALRAQRRAETLRAAMGPGNRDAAPLAEFQDVLQGYASRSRKESMERVARLLAEHPDFADAPRASFWLGEQLRKEGDDEAALARFQDVIRRWPGSDWTPRAHKAIGDLYLVRGAWDEAEGAYRLVATSPDASDQRVAEESLERLATARSRARIGLYAWLLLGVFVAAHLLAARRLAGSWREAARALSRPPVEVLYFLPVGLLFVLAAATENWALTHAVELVCGGGFVVIWLSAGALELVRRRAGGVRGRHVAMVASAAVVAVGSLFWLALTRERLLDMLLIG
jgi:TolA-binding protein